MGQEAGYPRTYVRVADDGPTDPWDAARTLDLVRGVKTLRDVVLTNGPMLRVTANGAAIGEVARGSLGPAGTRGRTVEVRVHVESAPWVLVDEVRIVRASAPEDLDANLVRHIAAKANAAGAMVANVTFVLRAAADDAFVVIASGKTPMAPVLAAAAGAENEIAPWAMTGAIWIDADGDGKALGR